MNIVYSSDENYAQHMCVSMVSVMENAPNEEIAFYIFDNGIKSETKDILKEICETYGQTVCFIDFGEMAEHLVQQIDCPISISTYARLFVPEMLPGTCKRVIYLDCDTVVCKNIRSLWEVDLEKCYVGGVLDTLATANKTKIGLSSEDDYINAGVLLIDVEQLRLNNIQQCFTDYIREKNGKVFYQDQGVINTVLNKMKKVIAPRFNTMTPMLTSSYQRFIAQSGLESYYSEEEINDAVNNTVILHFTPEYVGRVWEKKCLHPRKQEYYRYLDLTPWKGKLLPTKKEPIKIRVLYWMERNLPLPVLKFIGL